MLLQKILVLLALFMFILAALAVPVLPPLSFISIGLSFLASSALLIQQR